MKGAGGYIVRIEDGLREYRNLTRRATRGLAGRGQRRCCALGQNVPHMVLFGTKHWHFPFTTFPFALFQHCFAIGFHLSYQSQLTFQVLYHTSPDQRSNSA